tara:strand:- start:125 stop:379 length:255 start_codon:yes stop_codon:yes gene_type:complete
VGECYLHTVEVAGSNPVPPTTINEGLQRSVAVNLFYWWFVGSYPYRTLKNKGFYDMAIEVFSALVSIWSPFVSQTALSSLQAAS